ncbi:hypothetical protein OI18_08475 [Flavihumibacter solisilvae]|uniref:Activator of Hsp90 ATPase homologue 1/2-like C-terminal domain-containing protein n=2 Tax=Flavihumibacter solisilvae TaxID=1349421 RepID=A0A0C1IXB3_9BACT|nr:hypothetical protein OI18_08475 [Flavihumibacter solisilvae]
MSRFMFAETTIIIHAERGRVWDILVSPDYIRSWDDLPKDFNESRLEMGTEIKWTIEPDKFTTLTVTAWEPEQYLQQSLYVSTWEKLPSPGDIAYHYILKDNGTTTLLSIRVGDFSLLSNGESFYEASVEFADRAAQKIKELAEA